MFIISEKKVILPPKKMFWKVEEHWKWKGERSNENFVGHNVSTDRALST